MRENERIYCSEQHIYKRIRIRKVICRTTLRSVGRVKDFRFFFFFCKSGTAEETQQLLFWMFSRGVMTVVKK